MTIPTAAEEFVRVLEIMATLRGPQGCPWDREQTVDSLKPFVLEETYEVLQAIDHHDHEALREELGDFIFEAVFLAELEAEAGRFTIADSLKSIGDKLVRRHPHVFARAAGEAPLSSAGQVRTRWEEIKAQERAGGAGGAGRAGQAGGDGATGEHAPKPLLGGIPPVLPALLRAYQIGLRAASVGFDWTGAGDVVDKIQEEVDELREVVGAGALDPARAEEEMGDLLFAIANLSRKLGLEPETALRKANDKFTKRFGAMERRIADRGRSIRNMSLDNLETEWQRTKSLENPNSPSRSLEGHDDHEDS
jgi:nucleoside triphosphate diphosphatase